MDLFETKATLTLKTAEEMLLEMVVDRPLVFFDLETTGTDKAEDRIVQLGVVSLDPNGERKSFKQLINPGRVIPEGATEVHGISNEDVKDAPRWEDLCSEFPLYKAFHRSDWAGYNLLRFDVPVLINEFARVSRKLNPRGRRIVDLMKVFHTKEPRDLSAAVKKYTAIDNFEDAAHDALVDVEATIQVAAGISQTYALGSLDELHELSQDPGALDFEGCFKLDGTTVRFGFGKHRSKVAVEEQNYLDWMIEKGGFSEETLFCARWLKEGKPAEELREALERS